jgi:hypothetical protein
MFVLAKNTVMDPKGFPGERLNAMRNIDAKLAVSRSLAAMNPMALMIQIQIFHAVLSRVKKNLAEPMVTPVHVPKKGRNLKTISHRTCPRPLMMY